jgi:hypothetical protein
MMVSSGMPARLNALEQEKMVGHAMERVSAVFRKATLQCAAVLEALWD